VVSVLTCVLFVDLAIDSAYFPETCNQSVTVIDMGFWSTDWDFI